MDEPLRGRVVVVTGASSGLGRAAAVAFARRHCRVALAARRVELLDDVARECVDAGGEAIAIETDVTREADVDALVRDVTHVFGRIDVWVNNAGTTLFAGLEQGDFADHRRVIETNLLAPMYCARQVLPVFRAQGRGTLINVGSVLSQVGQPYVPTYVISKFGLRGLTEALRTEVADLPDVHVCTIMPFAVDTPHFETAANAIGRKAYAMQPVQTPQVVADALVDLAIRPRRQRYVPRYMALGIAAHWLAPTFTERVLGHVLARFHLGGPQRPTDGNLYTIQEKHGSVTGHRPPTASTSTVVWWALGDAVRTLWSSVSRMASRWRLPSSTP